LTGAALFASPWLSESMNVSMFRRSASMHGAMLPLMSMTNTMSATPFVFERACGRGGAGAGASIPGEPASVKPASGATGASIGPAGSKEASATSSAGGAGASLETGSSDGVVPKSGGEDGSGRSVPDMLSAPTDLEFAEFRT
jgi:hypothetical protein